MAVDRGDHARGLPARSAFVGAVLGVAAVTAALVFVPSLDHLATTPRLYGWTWDLALHDSTANTPCGAGDYGISDAPGTAALSEVCTQNVQLDGHPVAALAFTRLRGVPMRAAVVEGRAPRSPREIAVGTKTLDVLGKRIGDTVHAKGRSRALDFRIVGRVALPTLGQSQPLDDGAIFTGRGFAPLFDQNLFERYFVVRFARGADAAAVTARLVAIPQLERQSGPNRPVEIARVQQVNWFPYTLAILLGMLGLVALLHALMTSVQRRRGEFAVLKTLGFTRRQVRATVAWHATTLGVVGLIVGIPVGLVIGAVVWHAVADGFGTATATATSALAVLVLVPGALVVVNLAALLPGWVAGRADPAVALRSE